MRCRCIALLLQMLHLVSLGIYSVPSADAIGVNHSLAIFNLFGNTKRYRPPQERELYTVRFHHLHTPYQKEVILEKIKKKGI